MVCLSSSSEEREREKQIFVIAACDFFCLVTGKAKATVRPAYSLLVIEHPILVVMAKLNGGLDFQ